MKASETKKVMTLWLLTGLIGCAPKQMQKEDRYEHEQAEKSQTAERLKHLRAETGTSLLVEERLEDWVEAIERDGSVERDSVLTNPQVQKRVQCRRLKVLQTENTRKWEQEQEKRDSLRQKQKQWRSEEQHV